MTYANGDTYEGTFSAQKLKHGRGVYMWHAVAAGGDDAATAAAAAAAAAGEAEGEAPALVPARYDGQYVDGKRQGLGKMSFPNGERYHGACVLLRAVPLRLRPAASPVVGVGARLSPRGTSSRRPPAPTPTPAPAAARRPVAGWRVGRAGHLLLPQWRHLQR